jgi:hypothetical protein
VAKAPRKTILAENTSLSIRSILHHTAVNTLKYLDTIPKYLDKHIEKDRSIDR